MTQRGSTGEACKFHLAYSVADLDLTRKFYGKILGCKEGRSTSTWVDFDFWGNQLSLHVGSFVESKTKSQVEGEFVPIPHFGAILEWEEFHSLADRMRNEGVNFVKDPQIRF